MSYPDDRDEGSRNLRNAKSEADRGEPSEAWENETMPQQCCRPHRVVLFSSTVTCPLFLVPVPLFLLCWERINQDELKSLQRCEREAGERLRGGRSVVIDATNAGVRGRWKEGQREFATH